MARERKKVQVLSKLSDQELVDKIDNINRQKAQEAEDIRLGRRPKPGPGGAAYQNLAGTDEAEAEIQRRKKAGTWTLGDNTSPDVSPAPRPSVPAQSVGGGVSAEERLREELAKAKQDPDYIPELSNEHYKQLTQEQKEEFFDARMEPNSRRVVEEDRARRKAEAEQTIREMQEEHERLTKAHANYMDELRSVEGFDDLSRSEQEKLMHDLKVKHGLEKADPPASSAVPAPSSSSGSTTPRPSGSASDAVITDGAGNAVGKGTESVSAKSVSDIIEAHDREINELLKAYGIDDIVEVPEEQIDQLLHDNPELQNKIDDIHERRNKALTQLREGEATSPPKPPAPEEAQPPKNDKPLGKPADVSTSVDPAQPSPQKHGRPASPPQSSAPQAQVTSAAPPQPPAGVSNSQASRTTQSTARTTATTNSNVSQSVVKGPKGAKNLRVAAAAAVLGTGGVLYGVSKSRQQVSEDMERRRVEMQRRGVLS